MPSVVSNPGRMVAYQGRTWVLQPGDFRCREFCSPEPIDPPFRSETRCHACRWHAHGSSGAPDLELSTVMCFPETVGSDSMELHGAPTDQSEVPPCPWSDRHPHGERCTAGGGIGRKQDCLRRPGAASPRAARAARGPSTGETPPSRRGRSSRRPEGRSTTTGTGLPRR